MNTLLLGPAFFFLVISVTLFLGIAFILFRLIFTSRRARSIAASIIVVLLLLVACFNTYTILMNNYPLEPGNQQFSWPVETVQSYGNAWNTPPKKNNFPSWIKDPSLFNPDLQETHTPLGVFSYIMPNPQGNLAGYSDFSPTREKAINRAWEQVINKIKNLTLLGLGQKLDPNPGNFSNQLEGSILQSIINKEITRDHPGFRTDLYVDTVMVGRTARINTPLGKVYRAAVLVYFPFASRDKIVKKLLPQYRLLQQKQLAKRRINRQNWFYTGITGIFLFLVIFSIYLFLNSHTKGYFSWPLRILAALIYGASVGGFWMFLHFYD